MRADRREKILKPANPTEVYIVTVMPKAVGEAAFDLLVRDEDLSRSEASRKQAANGFGEADPYAEYRESFDTAKATTRRYTHREGFYAEAV